MYGCTHHKVYILCLLLVVWPPPALPPSAHAGVLEHPQCPSGDSALSQTRVSAPWPWQTPPTHSHAIAQSPSHVVYCSPWESPIWHIRERGALPGPALSVHIHKYVCVYVYTYIHMYTCACKQLQTYIYVAIHIYVTIYTVKCHLFSSCWHARHRPCWALETARHDPTSPGALQKTKAACIPTSWRC